MSISYKIRFAIKFLQIPGAKILRLATLAQDDRRDGLPLAKGPHNDGWWIEVHFLTMRLPRPMTGIPIDCGVIEEIATPVHALVRNDSINTQKVGFF